MKIKSFILWFLFLIVDKTCRWQYQGQDDLNKLIKSDSPILLCMWHGNFIFPMIYFKRFLPQIQVISSTHNDSNILANVLKKYGFYLIKGSSSRGAKNVLKEMIGAYKQSDSIIAITNDGPKGPPRIAKEGSVALAYKLNAHIVFMTGRASSFWKIKTWDHFVFPKPFSKNTVYIKKIKFPEGLDKKEVAPFATSAMNRLEYDIDKNNL